MRNFDGTVMPIWQNANKQIKVIVRSNQYLPATIRCELLQSSGRSVTVYSYFVKSKSMPRLSRSDVRHKAKKDLSSECQDDGTKGRSCG